MLVISWPPNCKVMEGGRNSEVAVHWADDAIEAMSYVPVETITWTVLPGDADAPAVGFVPTTVSGEAEGPS